jgi:hypothetical protein
MSKAVDLYSLLRGYAHKNNSAYIEIGTFLGFLQKYAVHKAPEQPEWTAWTTDTQAQFWAALPALAESEKCFLIADTAEGRIFMPSYCIDRIREAYRDIDKTADRPFPDEITLQVQAPENHVKEIELLSGMGVFFDSGGGEETDADAEPEEREQEEKEQAAEPGQSPGSVVRLLFPLQYGTALLADSMIPRRLMEAAFLKVRYYLHNRNNRDYALNKLYPKLPGKEKYLLEMIDKITFRPLECLEDMEKPIDFPYLFWTYFCPMVKNDIKEKNELSSEDLAVIQAVYVIEACSVFYREAAARKREAEVAFKTLDVRMEQPPWYFTMEEITGFTTDKGVPLLGLYSKQALEAYIQDKITTSDTTRLPEWLLLQNSKGGRWFTKKEKYLVICTRMLIDTRPLIKKEAVKRWTKMIREFQNESAMEKDTEFDKLLAAFTEAINPDLTLFLRDTKLLLVYEELERAQVTIPPAARIFKTGRLLPMNVLHLIRRKDILAAARAQLPFWYSVPVLVAIAAFFKKIGKKEKKPSAGYKIETAASAPEEPKSGGKETKTVQRAAKAIEAEIVPPGKTSDQYLAELEGRWSRLLDNESSQNLILDVQTLVRDSLRRTLKMQKDRKITRETVSETIGFLVSRTPALYNLGSQDALRLYMELYMVKLMSTMHS